MIAMFLGICVAVAIMLLAVYCSYYNGVNDGYGACIEPENPGYQKALKWLKKNSNVYKVHN